VDDVERMPFTVEDRDAVESLQIEIFDQVFQREHLWIDFANLLEEEIIYRDHLRGYRYRARIRQIIEVKIEMHGPSEGQSPDAAKYRREIGVAAYLSHGSPPDDGEPPSSASHDLLAAGVEPGRVRVWVLILP
jgi:hypothetical protein